MKYLNAEEISAINEVVVEESGGSIGIREAGLLNSIAVWIKQHSKKAKSK